VVAPNLTFSVNWVKLYDWSKKVRLKTYMFRIERLVKVVRRTILLVLIVIILQHYVQKWTHNNDRGINDPIKEVQADGAFTKISIGKTFDIDEDTFTADDVYVTSKQILVTYTYRAKHNKYAWSFPAMILKLETPDGQKLESHNAGSSGTTWGERGYISYNLPNKPVDYATLIYEQYDRFAKLEIPLIKAGEGT
jgi:hypothetical protein